MKVLLVNPARPMKDAYNMPPIHLLYIAQAIRRTGHDAEIVDIPYLINNCSSRFNLNDDSGIDFVLAKDFDVLGIGSVVSAYSYCERLVKKLKKHKRNIPIIIGGSLGLPIKDLWEKYAPVDYICEADGELVIEKFMNYYPHDLNSLKKIPGLYYLNDKGKYAGNKPELPMNLDYIPFVTYDEIDIEYYMKSLRGMIMGMLSRDYYYFRAEERFLPIIFSRGCVYDCTFCFHFNRLHRKHSANYIADYIEFLIAKYKVTAFMIIDDLAIIDKNWLIGILNEISRREIRVSFFSGGGKSNIVDKEILLKMKEVGYKRLSFGIESGSDTMLKIMNKSATVADNFRAISLIKEVGIPSATNIVFGMPGENHKTMQETANFLINLDLNTKQYYASLAVPYPGSPLFQYALDKCIIQDTREYLLNIGGYGDYKYNLTDMLKDKFLAKVLDVRYKVDIAYYSKRKKILKVIRLILMRYTHILYGLIVPHNIRKKIRMNLWVSSIKGRLIFSRKVDSVRNG